MKNFLLVVLVINPLITFAQLQPKSVNTDKGRIGFYEFKPSGYHPDSSYKYPLIIFLHGIGERGNGTTELSMSLNSSFPRILVQGATMKFVVNGKQHAFLVLIPQMSKDYENWQNFYVDAMIDYAKKNLKIDENKIFLTGWSLGGGGAWKYATASLENAKLLAGIIPVSPAPDYTDLRNLSLGRVAVWAHHARDDASVPLHYTEDAIMGINQWSPAIPARITFYPSGGHPYVANWAYDTLNSVEYPNVYQWMIGTSRDNSKDRNVQPRSKAGNDSTVILPSTRTILDGSASYDSNDVIVHYSWSVVAGPVSPELSIKKPNFPYTEVSGLEPGTYIFRLTVTDEFNVTGSDEVSIRVILPENGSNSAPVANAGPDVSTTEDQYHLTGQARDFDGRISNFHWRQVSGPAAITLQSHNETAELWGISKLGTYGIELAVYDDHKPAGMGRDTVFITRSPVLPVYFNYFSLENPFVADPDVFRYELGAVFCLLFSLPALILNKVVRKKKYGHLVWRSYK